MLVDPNQSNPFDKTLGGPKSDDFNHMRSIGILFRTLLRKEKIERIYATKSNSDSKEE